MNRTVIIGVFIMALPAIMPKAVLADWKVYYTGKAASMFGSYGRGNFATRARCEAYQATRPAFERSNSYCSGFDTPSLQSAKPGQQNHGNAAPAQWQQKQQLQPQGQPDRAQEKEFAKDKAQLLGTIKMPGADDGLRPGGTSFFGLGGVISPSQFVTPAMCMQAKRDREMLKKRLADLQEQLRSLDSSVRISDEKIFAEKIAKVHAMLGVASSLLDLGAPAIEKGAAKYLKEYRVIQTTLAGLGIGSAVSEAELQKTVMDAVDKCNDLTKEISLDPKAPEDVRMRLEGTNRILSVLNKAVAFEIKQRGEDKARDVDTLAKDYVRLANDMLAVYYLPALPASVGMDVDESLNAYRDAQDVERRLNLLKAAQFNAREYFDGEILNVHTQLEGVERTIEMCDQAKQK